jgi:aldose 1-epimerase
VTLSTRHRPQPGNQWHLELQIAHALRPDGLTVTCRSVEAGSDAAPFGVGFHPNLTLGSRSIDELELTVPATRYISTSARPTNH